MDAEYLTGFAGDADKLRGWLLTYFVCALVPAIIYPGIFFAELITGEDYGNLGEGGAGDYAFLAITVFLPASLLFRGHIWVPFVHSTLNCILFVSLILTVPPVALWCLAWGVYWIRSKRVSLTYSNENHVWGNAAKFFRRDD